MKKISKWIVLGAASAFLCACSTKNVGEENLLDLTGSAESPSVSDTSAGETMIPGRTDITGAAAATITPVEPMDNSENGENNTATLLPQENQESEGYDWRMFTCYTDANTSIRNSNLLNYGYLTYDEKGNIYFVDKNTGGIYASDCYGANKRLLSEDSGFDLQIAGEWLYYNSAAGGIKKIHIETGKVEQVYEAQCGEFILSGNRSYINSGEGFFSTDFDGSNKEIITWIDALDDTNEEIAEGRENLELANFSTNDSLWLGNLISGTDVTWFLKGYIICYDEENKEATVLQQRGMYPLLAGHMISVVDMETNTRHVWNVETGEDIDLEINAHRVVSDGETIYYLKNHYPVYSLYGWNGGREEEIFSTEAENIEFTYLTPNVFYWLAKVKTNGKSTQQLGYYDLKTGKNGVIY